MWILEDFKNCKIAKKIIENIIQAAIFIVSLLSYQKCSVLSHKFHFCLFKAKQNYNQQNLKAWWG